MKRTVVGIIAHVDSGKTTLSEAILYRSGEIRKLGRVDSKNAYLDTHEIERDRGITVFSSQAEFTVNQTAFTLLDTPGHVDFSSETERTLQVLDCAVLVISGTDGVQNHTETLWELLKKYNIPTFVFVNKMDLNGADKDKVMAGLTRRLGGGFVDFSKDGDSLNENLALCDEKIMEQLLDEETVCHELICNAIAGRRVFPCYFGTALKLGGVDEFLQGLEKYAPCCEQSDKFSAKVFKISEDNSGARLTFMKITGGRLAVRDSIEYRSRLSENLIEKVSGIRIYSGAKFASVDAVECGEVCAVTGLTKTYAGQGLGAEFNSAPPQLEPVLSYSVVPGEGTDVYKLLQNLRRLEEEEPELNVIWNEQLKEIHVSLMGEIQLEVLKKIIEKRFGERVNFGQGSIAYKETIAKPTEGDGSLSRRAGR